MQNRIERVIQLTEEVDNFIKFKSEKLSNGSYKVNKTLFLESIIGVYERSNYDEIDFEYDFLNTRINQKYHQVYHRLRDITTEEELFSDISIMIVEHLRDKEDIIIDFSNYKRNKDDISYIIFLIDKEVHRKVLEDNGLVYNRKKEDEESKKYFKQFDNLIWIDEATTDCEGNTADKVNNIREDEVIKARVTTEEDLERYEQLIDSVGLTNRQKEILEIWRLNNYNQRQTAIELGIRYDTLKKTISRIRDNFSKYDPNKVKEQDPKVVNQLETLLDSPEADLRALMEFTKGNIKNSTISNLIHNTDDVESRQEYIRYVRGKEYNIKKVNNFMIEFLNRFYKLD